MYYTCRRHSLQGGFINITFTNPFSSCRGNNCSNRFIDLSSPETRQSFRTCSASQFPLKTVKVWWTARVMKSPLCCTAIASKPSNLSCTSSMHCELLYINTTHMSNEPCVLVPMSSKTTLNWCPATSKVFSLSQKSQINTTSNRRKCGPQMYSTNAWKTLPRNVCSTPLLSSLCAHSM